MRITFISLHSHSLVICRCAEVIRSIPYVTQHSSVNSYLLNNVTLLNPYSLKNVYLNERRKIPETTRSCIALCSRITTIICQFVSVHVLRNDD